MAFAIKIGLRNDNPLVSINRYRLGSHHTWTDQELAAYEARWPLGTRERLAFALLLYTGQRVGDVVKLKRSDIIGGGIQLVQQKTGTPLAIPIHPALERALRAGPARGLFLIGDKNGRPIAAASLTRLIKRAVADAGLPNRCKPHGLRKAIYAASRSMVPLRNRSPPSVGTRPLVKSSVIRGQQTKRPCQRRRWVSFRTKSEHQLTNPSAVSQFRALRR